ncbi:hypothetical protein BDV18DRAFT_146740 [Aspergillus unguis]
MSNLTLRPDLLTHTADPHAKIGKYTTWDAFQVFKLYLEDNNKLSTQEAFETLYQMMPDEYFEASAEEDDLSCVIVQVARQVPYWHPSQAKLIGLVQLLGTADKFNKQIPGPGYATYDKLGSLLQEVYERHWHFVHDETGPDQLLNLSAFVARLTTGGIATERSYFVWCMRRLECEAEHITSTDVQVAAVWALCAGHIFFNQLVLYPPSETDHHKQIYRCETFYIGPIFGRERWDFWHRRMAELCGSEAEFDDETRALGRKAADLMAALSRSLEW